MRPHTLSVGSHPAVDMLEGMNMAWFDNDDMACMRLRRGEGEGKEIM